MSRLKSRIVSILVDSFVEGTAIGLKLKGSKEIIPTAVSNLDTFSTSCRWFEIRPYTLYGYPVEQTRFYLNEIQSLTPFTVNYDDPVYAKLREVRAKVLNLK